MKKKWTKTALALSIGIASAQTLANGLAINEQSASGAGTAYAGRASSTLDASTIYGNPAGMSKLKRTEISGGLAIVDAKDDISQAHSAATGTNKGDSVPLAAVPFGYIATPLDDKVSIGLGIYVPYGLINDYESSFQGRAHGSNSRVQVVTVQPTISYQFNDLVSVGFGPTINRIDGTLENYLLTNGVLGATQDTKISIKGDDTAAGYNIGVLLTPTEMTSLGATYHSKVDYKLDGHTTISGSPMGLIDSRMDAKLDITLPESLEFSITQKLDDRWTVYGGTIWTRWSRLKEIEIRNSGAPQASFDTIGEDLSWHDTWSAAIGTSYQLNDQWVLRTGFAYDPSPTTNEHRDVRIPVGDRKIFTLGAGYSPNLDMTFDFAYAYLWESTASVSHPDGESLGPINLQPAYSAKYDNSAHAITAQMTYRY